MASSTLGSRAAANVIRSASVAVCFVVSSTAMMAGSAPARA